MNGNTVKDSVLRLLSSIITDTSAWNINGTGAYQKLQASELRIIGAVKGTISFNLTLLVPEAILRIKTSTATEPAIECEIEMWLNNSRDRSGGRRMRREKPSGQTNEAL